jgi:phage shock protein C
VVCLFCGTQIAEQSSYCNFCGARQCASYRAKRLTRSSVDCKIAGVCAGIAEYFSVDPTIVRLIWLALSVFPGGIVGGIVAYSLAWIVIPKAVTSTRTASGAALEQPVIRS